MINNLKGTLDGPLLRGYSAYALAVENGFKGTVAEWLESLKGSVGYKITSLTDTPIASGTIVESVGIPVYVSDVTEYSEFGITKTGWYVFARISAEDGAVVTSETAIEGTEGYIAVPGSDHVDVAVRFGVAAVSQNVTINWGTYTETYVFKATDLAVRNLDYRSTFYVYDISEFTEWSYRQSEEATFDGTVYYTEQDGVYTQAAVIAGDPVPEETYYVHAYVLTTDETFVEGVTYYTKHTSEDDGVSYVIAEVVPGEAVTENTYYIDSYELTTDKVFTGKTYYTGHDGEYTKVGVRAGDPVPAYYEDHYFMTTDETFIEGRTYYTLQDNLYTVAEVTPGEAVPADTYYEHDYILTADETFVEGKTYYVKQDNLYTVAEVTPGEAVPAFYNHSKLTFEGMTRNITYRFNEMVDCPIEVILPEIESDGYGAWFEIQLRYKDSYSCTLVPPSDDVKAGTAATQRQTAGVNVIDLHYTDVGGAKLWTLINTHSDIPADIPADGGA